MSFECTRSMEMSAAVTGRGLVSIDVEMLTAARGASAALLVASNLALSVRSVRLSSGSRTMSALVRRRKVSGKRTWDDMYYVCRNESFAFTGDVR